MDDPVGDRLVTEHHQRALRGGPLALDHDRDGPAAQHADPHPGDAGGLVDPVGAAAAQPLPTGNARTGW
jgi:hypothetical protein